jgi:hypothetical protein
MALHREVRVDALLVSSQALGSSQAAEDRAEEASSVASLQFATASVTHEREAAALQEENKKLQDTMADIRRREAAAALALPQEVQGTDLLRNIEDMCASQAGAHDPAQTMMLLAAAYRTGKLDAVRQILMFEMGPLAFSVNLIFLSHFNSHHPTTHRCNSRSCRTWRCRQETGGCSARLL